MAITIAVISYYKLTNLVNKAKYVLPPDTHVRVINCNLLTNPGDISKALALRSEADVFISAGANYQILSEKLHAPLVEIQVTLTDVLLAAKEAKTYSDHAALIKFREEVAYLEDIKELLNYPITQYVYQRTDEGYAAINQCLQKGIQSFIGSSLIHEYVVDKGYQCSFLYSEDGVVRAFETAVKVAQTRQQEMIKTEELKTILRSTQEGIVATNNDGVITVFNPSAEKITKIQKEKVIGKQAEEVLPELELHSIQHSGRAKLNQVQSIDKIKILTNRVPIKTKQGISGMIATFNDIGMVQKAEQKIRVTLHQKGFVARINFADILGDSEAILNIKNMALQYARWKSSVLIMGDSGTGKELFAQAIHNESLNREGPFVAVNCAALPEGLLESELFGYESGAFTGAKKGGKQGLFELAHGGTIFLDEIGEMPKSIQSRLLRVIENHEVLPIGGERIIPIDIRIISATNKDLWKLVQTGEFRNDLYYRLSVLELRIPSLKERQSDIPCLAYKFLSELRPDLPNYVIEKVVHSQELANFNWEGNVRQLRNMIERFAVLYNNQVLEDELINKLLYPQKLIKDDEEYANILKVLSDVGGNKSLAAKRLGISRSTLWRKLK